MYCDVFYHQNVIRILLFLFRIVLTDYDTLEPCQQKRPPTVNGSVDHSGSPPAIAIKTLLHTVEGGEGRV